MLTERVTFVPVERGGRHLALSERHARRSADRPRRLLEAGSRGLNGKQLAQPVGVELCG